MVVGEGVLVCGEEVLGGNEVVLIGVEKVLGVKCDGEGGEDGDGVCLDYYYLSYSERVKVESSGISSSEISSASYPWILLSLRSVSLSSLLSCLR